MMEGPQPGDKFVSGDDDWVTLMVDAEENPDFRCLLLNCLALSVNLLT